MIRTLAGALSLLLVQTSGAFARGANCRPGEQRCEDMEGGFYVLIMAVIAFGMLSSKGTRQHIEQYVPGGRWTALGLGVVATIFGLCWIFFGRSPLLQALSLE